MKTRIDEYPGLLEFGLDHLGSDWPRYWGWEEEDGPFDLFVPLDVRAGELLVRQWLRVGERCCSRPPGCCECGGTGVARQPLGAVADALPVEALEWAMERVRDGLPVRGVLGEWTPDRHKELKWWWRGGRYVVFSEVRESTGTGWHDYGGDSGASGPETGDAGRAAADRAALAEGYWLEGGPFEVSS